jgi:[ribosomal protein S5]-alanine N-acetyltransferase
MEKHFEMERLIVRPFDMGDLNALYQQIYSDPEVTRYFSGQPYSLEETRDWLIYRIGAAKRGDFFRWAVIRKAEQQFLGQVGLDAFANCYYRYPEDPNPQYNAVEVELNFAFGRAFWGQGYAYEACQPVIRYALKVLRLPRLVSGAHYDNSRSMRLQKRLGFRVVDNQHPEYREYASTLENDMV